jgi:hypothetical protein
MWAGCPRPRLASVRPMQRRLKLSATRGVGFTLGSINGYLKVSRLCPLCALGIKLGSKPGSFSLGPTFGEGVGMSARTTDT